MSFGEGGLLFVILLFVLGDCLEVLFADFIFDFEHPLKVASAFVFWGDNWLFFLARVEYLFVQIIIVRKVFEP